MPPAKLAIAALPLFRKNHDKCLSQVMLTVGPPSQISQICSWALDKRQAIRNRIRDTRPPQAPWQANSVVSKGSGGVTPHGVFDKQDSEPEPKDAATATMREPSNVNHGSPNSVIGLKLETNSWKRSYISTTHGHPYSGPRKNKFEFGAGVFPKPYSP